LTALAVSIEALLLSGGCSGGPKRELVFPVTGKLTYKGKPMKGARIDFLPLNDPQPAIVAGGIADDDGIYHLTSYKPKDGSPAGEFIVTVVWPRPGPPLDEAGTLPDQLKRAYATRKSGLRATVQQQNNVIDLDLK
jgi:hypothetical protein